VFRHLQTMDNQGGSHLLTYAIARLSPEVFSHPVWVRFGRLEVSTSPKTIDNLLSAAKNLQDKDPSSACQILLVCAVNQTFAGRLDNALRTSHQSLTLAEHAKLVNETIWAEWGTCAIYIQQGKFEQAARQLENLQEILSKHNEWMLADFIDVVKQSLLIPVTVGKEKLSISSNGKQVGDLLVLTHDWLLHWGASSFILESTLEVNTPKRKLMSFWESILRSMHLNQFERKNGPQIDKDTNHLPSRSIPLPIKKSSSKGSSHPSKPVFKNNQTSEQVNLTHMVVQMLGPFSITTQDLPHKFPASRGLSVLKYLLLHHKQDIPREVLMDIFWPDIDPEAARNNLNVAMHNLRQTLQSITDIAVIHFENGAYGLAPNIEMWLDVDEFERCVKEGQQLEARNQLATAVTEYEIAVNLYQGDFLVENPYEAWTVLDRERLRIAYLDTLDRLSHIYFNQGNFSVCTATCQIILQRDNCREDAHCLLMRCYCQEGQYHLALRQYETCCSALKSELDVEPAPTTNALVDRIRRHERV
jgi:DNA-binding SARP family transcriptional activator